MHKKNLHLYFTILLFLILITILILWYEELKLAFMKFFQFLDMNYICTLLKFSMLCDFFFFCQIMVIELHYYSWSGLAVEGLSLSADFEINP